MSKSDRIERAARVIGSVMSRWDMDGRPDVDGGIDTLIARALDQAGVLAPAPLREEWAATWEGHGATRIGVAQESPEDIEGVPPGGWVVHRYVTAWQPADGIDRSEGGKAATSE